MLIGSPPSSKIKPLMLGSSIWRTETLSKFTKNKLAVDVDISHIQERTRTHCEKWGRLICKLGELRYGLCLTLIIDRSGQGAFGGKYGTMMDNSWLTNCDETVGLAGNMPYSG